MAFTDNRGVVFPCLRFLSFHVSFSRTFACILTTLLMVTATRSIAVLRLSGISDNPIRFLHGISTDAYEQIFGGKEL